MSSGPSQEPLYIIKESSIHNHGVFASRDIKKGERVIEYQGEKITKAESERRGLAHMDEAARSGRGAVYLFILNKKHDLDGSMDWNLARLINHSCDSNCEAQIIRGKIWIVAKRRIKKGDELSFDYGFDLDCWQEHPCLCGSQKCVGYIVGRQYWPKLKKLVAERDAFIDEVQSTPPSKPPVKPVSRRADKRRGRSGEGR